MRPVIFVIILFSFICSCNSNSKQPDINQGKFDKTKWKTKEDKNYPYRSDMLDDLINNQKLKGLKKVEVIDMLGEPDRVDSNYLFYRIAEKRIGSFPLSNKTLVIKLSADTVEWRKIHG